MLKVLIHSGLSTKDLNGSIDFYEKAFGFEVIFKEENIKEEIESITGLKNQKCSLAQLSIEGSSHIIELLQFHGQETQQDNKISAPIRPGQGHIAFNVTDFDNWVDKLTKLKAKILGKITHFPEGKAAYFIEPSGTFFEISEAKFPEKKNETD